jgi:predicted flap endonuclease-1-like 5' DNA nuclease
MKRRLLVFTFLVLPLLGTLAVLVWWWLRWRSEEEMRAAEKARLSGFSTDADQSRGRPSAGQADDLRLIEGIGPKIRAVLADAGVVTFVQLATCKVDWLRQILTNAGIRLAYPDTWPEQAEFAAAGDWDGLSALQAQLNRGRRV